jgi:hypothetical protein
LSALSWFLLPVIILIFYHKDLLNKTMYVFSLLNFIFSLMFFILIEEVVEPSNSVLGSVNFIWQLIISLYILSIVSIAYFINSIKRNGSWKMKDIIVFFILLFYAIGGVIYLYNSVFSKIIV